MVQAARQSGRHRVRDAAMILMMFRHGLRTAELVALRWQQVDLKAGYLDVHRVKRGHDAKHLRQAPALHKVQRTTRTPYVFVSERKAPLSPRHSRDRGEQASWRDSPSFYPHQLRHACGYYLASHGHDTERFRTIWGTEHSAHRALRRWRRTDLKTSGRIKFSAG
jgi:integrase